MLAPVKIDVVNTQAAIASDVWLANILVNIKRGLPRFHELEGFNKKREGNTTIALVGGGPSLKEHLDELRAFKTIMVSGSAHDYIREHGITPTYSVLCDPDKISSYYIRQSSPETTYLVATSCDEAVFEVLKDKKIYLWHCHSDDDFTKAIMAIEGNKYQAVAGGCTVGLRAITMALMLGYNDFHMFGYDSCISETDEPYAYKLDERDNMIDLMPETYMIGVGKETPGKKFYKCLGYQIGQARHFLDFHRVYGHNYKCTFHGEGLLKAVYEVETGGITNG